MCYDLKLPWTVIEGDEDQGDRNTPPYAEWPHIVDSDQDIVVFVEGGHSLDEANYIAHAIANAVHVKANLERGTS